MARKVKADWLVNVQGDLPFIHAATITRAVVPLRRDRTIPMGTVCTAIFDEEEWRNPNIVKVLTDRNELRDVFFPGADSLREKCTHRSHGQNHRASIKRRLWGYRHLGLYVYRRDFLLKFARLRPTPLEQIESLEQLRAVAKRLPDLCSASGREIGGSRYSGGLEKGRAIFEAAAKLKGNHGDCKN